MISVRIGDKDNDSRMCLDLVVPTIDNSVEHSALLNIYPHFSVWNCAFLYTYYMSYATVNIHFFFF